MIDPGYIVIAIFVGVMSLIFWSKRRPTKRGRTGDFSSLPGRRHEGADYTRSTSGGDAGDTSD